MVNLNLKGKDGDDIKISALCFEKICSPIPSKVQLDSYQHLMGLDLADSSLVQTNNQDDGVIDILIGSDYYYDIVMGEIVRGESGPVAVIQQQIWMGSLRAIDKRESRQQCYAVSPSNPTRRSCKLYFAR